MNFIDISSWQQGLDLAGLFGANPDLDGVIVKLTQGTGYINPEAASWLRWLTDSGKPFGTYHYLDGSGAEAEAWHYADELKKWPGGVLALDYEDTVLTKGTGYLKAALDEVHRLTGIKPLVYCSQSVIQAQDFTAISSAGYNLWMAQYADMATVNGFLDKPWHKGSVAPFSAYVMQQYTSRGRLNGWDNNLDFDKFDGDIEKWAALAGSDTPAPEPAPVLKPVDPVIVHDVLSGDYGTGLERFAKLTAAGYDADAVQKKINELYAVALSCKKYVDGNMDYLNSICWIARAL